MKKAILSSILVSTVILGGSLFLTKDASAHGYVEQPVSRGYQGALDKSIIGWSEASSQYGSVIDQPQSIEALKGFPNVGPLDGQLASAGNSFASLLDIQNPTIWKKNQISTGLNEFTWKYTAPHKTSKWHYYMTKKDWDSSQTLKRSDLEEIGEVIHDGSLSTENLTHVIDVPADREGYHVILAVWDVADTANAFYNVIDVNVSNNGEVETPDVEAPTQPTSLKAGHVSADSVELNWTASTDNKGVKEYNVYRDGKKIGTVGNTSYFDTQLIENTTYKYTVEAVDFSGNVSPMSQNLSVTTTNITEVDTEAPSAPKGLHTMSIGEDSANLMWSASTDNTKVKEYLVFRDGKKIATTESTSYTDKGLKAATEYTYKIQAVDVAGNKSEVSNELKVTTKASTLNPETEGSFNISTIYVGGEIVSYNGLEYQAKWWTQGESPDTSSVWELITKDVVLEWNSTKAYSGGDRVHYNGTTYEAKWWTQNNTPSTNSDVWVAVK